MPNAAAEKPAGNIVITGRRLDVARDSITPSLGASQYTFDKEALEKQPGGTNFTLNKSLLQAPGVVQDSYGVIHVRNEHANLQYRLNGVIVPESISGFGTTFDPRIASSIQLITGTLPAQYGYRTAGVVNFKTQSGLLGNGGEAGIYGGSFGWLEPSAMIQGSTGDFSYFLSGSYFRNDLGIENPLPTRNAIHDRTTQIRPFGYVSDILSESSRVALFGGSFIGHFEIPNVTGTGGDFTVNGVIDYDAAKLDQNQREITHYAVGTYQYAGDTLNFQVAPFIRYSQTRFTPDPNHGDMIFNGFADAARLSSLAAGVQADASRRLGTRPYVAFRCLLPERAYDLEGRIGGSSGGCRRRPTSDVPFTILDRGSKTGQLYGVYLQDEWKLTPKLTLNYGARYDIVRAYTSEQQLSPRANLVWHATPLTTLHIGYARNFTPPPQELIAPATVALYNGTTKQSEIQSGDPVKAEREHYFDAGVEQRFNGGFKIGVDAYYKIKRNLLDEGQFGAAVVLVAVQLCEGLCLGRRAQRQLHARADRPLCQHRARPGEGQGHHLGPIFLRAGRACIHSKPLHFHRPFAEMDGFGRRQLHDPRRPRHARSDRRLHLRFRPSDRRSQRDRSQRWRTAGLFRVQCRHLAELQRPRHAEGRNHPRATS